MKAIYWGQPAKNALVRPGSPLVPPKKSPTDRALCFTGTIPDVVLIQNALMTPIDYSVYFQACGEPISYSLSTVFTGLSFDQDTGILSGTPTNLGGADPAVTASNSAGQVQSNLFHMTVSAP